MGNDLALISSSSLISLRDSSCVRAGPFDNGHSTVRLEYYSNYSLEDAVSANSSRRSSLSVPNDKVKASS